MKSWDLANQFCHSFEGGHLVEVDNVDKYNNLSDYLVNIGMLYDMINTDHLVRMV